VSVLTQLATQLSQIQRNRTYLKEINDAMTLSTIDLQLAESKTQFILIRKSDLVRRLTTHALVSILLLIPSCSITCASQTFEIKTRCDHRRMYLSSFWSTGNVQEDDPSYPSVDLVAKRARRSEVDFAETPPTRVSVSGLMSGRLFVSGLHSDVISYFPLEVKFGSPSENLHFRATSTRCSCCSI
jgi:hypothetical protein